MKRLKQISSEILHENPWWKYKHDQYEKPNGQTGDYYYAESNGVTLTIPVLEDGRIVLTLQYRYLVQKQSIEFPCGGLKLGQNTLDGAKEELQEETGCIATDFAKIGMFEPSNGFVKDMTHVYIAKVVEQGPQRLDDTEEIELLYRRPDEIEDMIKRNDIWDGQTLASWALARSYFFAEQPLEEKPALNPLHKMFDTLLEI